MNDLCNENNRTLAQTNSTIKPEYNRLERLVQYNVHTTQSNSHQNTNVILQRKWYSKFHVKPQQILSGTPIRNRKKKARGITTSDVKTEHKATVFKEHNNKYLHLDPWDRNESMHLSLIDLGSKCQKHPLERHLDHY